MFAAVAPKGKPRIGILENTKTGGMGRVVRKTRPWRRYGDWGPTIPGPCKSFSSPGKDLVASSA